MKSWTQICHFFLRCLESIIFVGPRTATFLLLGFSTETIWPSVPSMGVCSLGFPYMNSNSPAFQFDDLSPMPTVTRLVSRGAKRTKNDPQETYIRASSPHVLSPEIPSLLILGLHLLVVDPFGRQVSALQLCAGHGEVSISDTRLIIPLSTLPHRACPTPARRKKRRNSWLEDFRSRGSWCRGGLEKVCRESPSHDVIPSFAIPSLHLLVVDPFGRQVSVLQLRAGHGEASISDTHLIVPLSARPHRARPTPARRHKRRVSRLEDFRSRGS
jgi:hypothetical protein